MAGPKLLDVTCHAHNSAAPPRPMDRWAQWSLMNRTSVQLMSCQDSASLQPVFSCKFLAMTAGFGPYTWHLPLLSVVCLPPFKPQALNFPDFSFHREEAPVPPLTDPGR